MATRNLDEEVVTEMTMDQESVVRETIKGRRERLPQITTFVGGCR